VHSGFQVVLVPKVPSEPVGVLALLGEEPDGFPRVKSDGSYVFPQDHGPHLDHHMETWAFNGYLATKTGRQLGFQLGILRVRLVPGNPQRKSAWATTEIYRGHLTITDIARQSFHSYERLSRAALGLSGAQSLPWRVWSDRFIEWFNGSFYGELARAVPAREYIAPPLDGVWATAPYLHNGGFYSNVGESAQ
jgi:hypothetical protein